MSEPRNRRKNRWIANLVAFLVAVSTVGIAIPASQASDETTQAVFGISKSVSIDGVEYVNPDAPQVTVGKLLQWNISLSCSQSVDQCINAKLTDVIPDEFEVVKDSIYSSKEADIAVNGQVVTITFKEPLATTAGGVGLNSGAEVKIPVKLRNIAQSYDGQKITNTASVVADNALEKSASASITASVPLVLNATGTKEFLTSSVLAQPDSPVEVSFGGANSSNSPVSSLTIQDPADPKSKTFETYLAVSSIGSTTWPEGATRAVVSVTTDGETWTSSNAVSSGQDLALPAGVSPSDILAVRVEFQSDSASIPINASGAINLNLKQRPAVAGLTTNLNLYNDSSVQVSQGDKTSPVQTKRAALLIRFAKASVTAGKVFTPDKVSLTGTLSTSQVRISARNTGTVPLNEMTIAEPSDPASATNIMSPKFGEGSVTFAGFANRQAWPAGATQAAITYFYADNTTSSDATSTLNEIPIPIPDKRVIGFRLTFTGAIAAGSEASLQFNVQAPETMNADTVTGTNEVTVTGSTPGNHEVVAPSVASDDLTIYNNRIKITTDKGLTKSELWAQSKQVTTVKLTAKVSDHPDTTVRPKQIVIDDPDQLTGLTDWYDYMDPSSIRITQIPTNATLTIMYRDEAGNFKPFDRMVDIPGETAGVFTADIPESLRQSVYGIRFIYNSNDGFVTGQTVAANITYKTREALRSTGLGIPLVGPEGQGYVAKFENCSSAQASSGAIVSNFATLETCPVLTLNDWDVNGSLLKMRKSWGPDLVYSNSAQSTHVDLEWGLNNLNNVSTVSISEPAVEPKKNPDPLTESAFNAFDATVIGPISDPQFAYDQVVIELFNSTTNKWEETSSCTTATPCTGTYIPAVRLSLGESATTTAVRLNIAEKAGRPAVTTNGEPAAGDGVSSGNLRRVPITLQLRSALRSDPSVPVIGDLKYNTIIPGEVYNSARIDGIMGTEGLVGLGSSDTAQIIDPELGVTATKSWDGGPVMVPKDWSKDEAPTTRVKLTATNTTARGLVSEGQAVNGIVDSLKISEPGSETPGTRTPFELFDVVRIQSLTAPSGTQNITLDLNTDGAAIPSITGATPDVVVAAFNALPEAERRTISGVNVTFEGKIRSGTTAGLATLELDLELRKAERSSGAPVLQVPNMTVDNDTLATVSVKRFNGVDVVTKSLGAEASASIEVKDAASSILAEKSFSVASQTEPSNADFRMTLSGTPQGAERTKEVILTDDSATFWNAYGYKAIANTLQLPAFSPANDAVIQVSTCQGRTFDAGAIQTNPQAGCAATGGTWSDWSAQMTAAQAVGWTPEAGADVQGIRFKISRSGGSQWANPYAPKVSVPVTVARRADLRTGGIVPSTLSTGTMAPGETALGVTTNSMNAQMVGIWGGKADSTDEATVTYAHAPNSIIVKKDPSASKAPAQTFPYTLTFANNGSRDITDPVVVDSLPWNAELGTLVKFDPNAAEDAQRYSYTLSGTNPATGTPMPVDPTAVTVVEDLTSNTPSLKFTFPKGTVLGKGQTYSITFPMQFVPGVLAGQQIVNSFAISGDRPWDNCAGFPGYTASRSEDRNQCSTSATTVPTVAASSWGVKSVRPLDSNGNATNTHGFTSERTSSTEAMCADRAVKDSGFSAFPCIPRTVGGQKEQWRLKVTNDGTANTTRMVVADYLPVEGDSSLLADLTRNSKWKATFTGEAPTILNSTNATLTSYESTATKANLCLAGVNDPSRVDECVDPTGADSSKWVPVGTSDPSKVTALMFVVDGEIVPGQVTDIAFNTTTATYAADSSISNPKAYNSLTVSSLWNDAGLTGKVLGRDQSLAGVSLMTGSVKINKSLVGDGVSFVPADTEFSGNLVCEVGGNKIPDRPFTIKKDETILIDNLPYSASCHVEESEATKHTSMTSSTVTVPDSTRGEAIPVLNLVNRYELTNLAVSKSVVTEATAIPSKFGFTAECSFLGQKLDLGADAKFTLDNGETRTITGIPVNSDCTVKETDARKATSTIVEGLSVNADKSPYGTVTIDNTERTVRIEGMAPKAGTNSAAFTNNYGSATQFQVRKDLVGGAAYIAANRTFTARAICTFEGEEILNKTVALNKGNGWSQVLAGVVAGASCKVSELSLQGANGVVITPNDGTDRSVGDITIPDGERTPLTITLTNRYLAGSLHVTKAVTGDGGDLYGTSDFDVELECTLDGNPVAIPGGSKRTVSAANPTADYTGLPDRSVCSIKETTTGGATESTMRQGTSPWTDAQNGLSFTVSVDSTDPSNDDQPLQNVEIDNRFDLAEVSVTKVVDSAAKDASNKAIDYGEFEVALECSFNGEPVAVKDAKRTVEAGETVTWNGLPAGAQCSVNETETRAAVNTAFKITDTATVVDGTTWEIASLKPVGPSVVNSASLINSYDSGSIELTKVIAGSAASSAQAKKFTAQVECVLVDAAHPTGMNVWSGPVSFESASGWKSTIEGVAAGSKCSVTETNTGGADSTEIAVDGKKAGEKSVEFTVGKSQSTTVQITNTFKAQPKLPVTGADVRVIGLAVLLMIGGGFAITVASRRRRES